MLYNVELLQDPVIGTFHLTLVSCCHEEESGACNDSLVSVDVYMLTKWQYDPYVFHGIFDVFQSWHPRSSTRSMYDVHPLPDKTQCSTERSDASEDDQGPMARAITKATRRESTIAEPTFCVHCEQSFTQRPLATAPMRLPTQNSPNTVPLSAPVVLARVPSSYQ